jgi:hypothetical protein
LGAVELLAVDVLEHMQGRNDVEDGESLDMLGEVEGHAVGDPPAPIVARDGKPLMAKVGHESHLVCRHGSAAVRHVGVVVLRSGAIPVAPKIRGNDREAFGEEGRNMSPHVRRLWIAVQEQERGTRTGDTRMDVDAIDVDIDAIKVGEGSTHYLVSAAA